MISQWFTASELASLCLSGMPESKFGVLKKAARESWKSQPRQGKGGGLEFHIASLPKASQLALVEKLVDASKIAPMPMLAATAATASNQYTADDRRNAKILIVKLFDRFRETSCLSIIQAERPFMLFYEQQRLLDHSDFIAKWVFDIYPSFSIQSLRGWRALRKKEDALEALSNHYGNRKGTGFIETAEGGALRSHIIALISAQPHLNGGHVRDLCRAKFGTLLACKDKAGNVIRKPLPTVRTFERFMADWKANNKELHLRITNPDAHKNRYMLSLGKADDGIDRLNQVWEIDASPADVLCVDGRYSLYGIIDVYSRRVIYMTTKTPRTEAALLLIRRAIIEWGVPEMIRTDNGSDFTSRQFVAALLALGIEHYVCPPFSGDKKPFVERSFQTLQHDLMPLLPGYIGHSVADRKAIESRRSFAKRLGEDDNRAFAVELSHTQLQDNIERWVASKYSHKIHGGLNGLSPFTKASQWSKPVKRIENVRALDMLLAPIAGGGGYRTVGKKGIRLDGGTFFSNGIIPFIGQKLFIRCNPEDMGTIYCFDENGLFVSEAYCFQREGVSVVEATARAKAAQRAFEKEQIEPLKREMKQITPAKMAESYLSQAEMDSGHLAAIPMRGETYSTPALAEAARATITPYMAASPRHGIDLEQFEKEFHESNSASPSAPISDEDRWWTRATTLIAMKDAGKQISPTDLKWLEFAITQGWFTARRDQELMCNSTG